MNLTDTVFKSGIDLVMQHGQEFAPRGKKIKEILGHQYTVEMTEPVITIASRNMNYSFMFAEAAWICSGSNWLEELTTYMKRYADFSDDGIFMHGAYGPKVVDQLTYVVKTLIKDNDSRQAVLNIWRERPGDTKDVPCTLSMQFFIRNKTLHLLVTMRSQDAVLGFSYDVFTFSMVANMVRLLLSLQEVDVKLGSLKVTAGSFHIYEEHFDKTELWLSCYSTDKKADKVLRTTEHLTRALMVPQEFITELRGAANE